MLRVQVRSVYFEDEARKLLHHLGTVLSSCLCATVVGLSKKPFGDVEHVERLVLKIGRCVQYVSGPSLSRGCGTYGRRSSGFWVSCTSRICVCRRLQSFGEASRLPRMAVACRNVYGRRSRAGISQRLSHPQQSL